MPFNRGLSRSERSPRKNRQAQVDGRRIQGVDGINPFKIGQRVIGVKFARHADEMLREVRVNPPIPLTAFALIIEMPELGALEAGQAASLAGLAPVARQSGRWTGRAFIRSGRASVRQALYMPALVAARFNPDLKAKYDQLTNAGKPAKIAITAIMRKLIVLANALISKNRLWIQKPA